MIDWKKECIKLAEIIDRHRKDRMHPDMLEGWALAEKLVRVKKLEERKRKKFQEYSNCAQGRKRKHLWKEYTDLTRKMEIEVNK